MAIKSRKNFLAGTTAGLLSLFAVGAVNASALTYSFTTGYAGNTITVTNPTSADIKTDTLYLTTKSPIQSVWGGFNPTVTTTQTGDNFLNQLTNQAQQLTVPANGNVSLTYTLGSQTAPNCQFSGLNMCGSYPSVITVGNDTVPLVITGGNATSPITNGKHLVGYFENWGVYSGTGGYTADKIPYDKIDTIEYAFMGINADGSIKFTASDQDPMQTAFMGFTRMKYPYLNVSLSFGGWNNTKDFQTLVAGANYQQNINTFITNAVALMKATNFNGIDIDWEYPVVGHGGDSNPQEATAFTYLITQLRAKLDAQAKTDSAQSGTTVHYNLSFAAVAANNKIDAISAADWQAVAQAVDYVNIMAYDMNGQFNQYNDSAPIPSGQAYLYDAYSQAPMTVATDAPNVNSGAYTVEGAITKYLSLGFKPSQIIVGVPAYGRAMAVTALGSNNNGLYQPLATLTLMTDQFNPEAFPAIQGEGDMTGIFSYHCIVESTTCKGHSIPTNCQLSTQDKDIMNSSWMYWASAAVPDKNGKLQYEVLNFDDPTDITNKTAYIKANNLGGVMFWALNTDVEITDSRSLIAAANAELNK